MYIKSAWWLNSSHLYGGTNTTYNTRNLEKEVAKECVQFVPHRVDDVNISESVMKYKTTLCCTHNVIYLHTVQRRKGITPAQGGTVFHCHLQVADVLDSVWSVGFLPYFSQVKVYIAKSKQTLQRSDIVIRLF